MRDSQGFRPESNLNIKPEKGSELVDLKNGGQTTLKGFKAVRAPLSGNLLAIEVCHG